MRSVATNFSSLPRAALLIVAVGICPARGEPTANRRCVTDPHQAVLADAADGRLDTFSLASAAIALSGAGNETEIDSYMDQLTSYSKRLTRRLAGENEPVERARIILRFLHERIMVGEYDAGCCDLRKTLEDGTYNCVTGTILFCELADLHGLKTTAVVAPAHVRCRLEADNEEWEVETTNRHGITRCVKLDPSIRDLTEVELVAKLIYNQGLRALDRNDFAAALEATEISWQLDPQHESAQENVAVVVNNWSLRLAADGDFEEAIQMLQRGQSLTPDFSLMRSNQLHIFLRWIHSERLAFRHAQAAEILQRAERLFPDDPSLASVMTD